MSDTAPIAPQPPVAPASAKPDGKPGRRWYQKKRWWVLAGFVVLVIVAAAQGHGSGGGGGPASASTPLGALNAAESSSITSLDGSFTSATYAVKNGHTQVFFNCTCASKDGAALAVVDVLQGVQNFGKTHRVSDVYLEGSASMTDAAGNSQNAVVVSGTWNWPQIRQINFSGIDPKNIWSFSVGSYVNPNL